MKTKNAVPVCEKTLVPCLKILLHVSTKITRFHLWPGRQSSGAGMLGGEDGPVGSFEAQGLSGKPYDPPRFAFRGSTAGVEFKTKHQKFVSALGDDRLPDYGEEGLVALDAYKEFLHGLDLINQQEPIQTGSKTGDLKRWERAIRQRANVRTQRLFDENLRQRVRRSMDASPADCALNQAPIREATRAYLTRQVETDYTILGVLSYIFTCFVYILNLATQIIQITEVCAMGYICPLGSSTAGLPLVAPPVAYRNLTSLAVASSGSKPIVKLADSWVSIERAGWGARVHETCGQKDVACETPGYEVQWPYIQGSPIDGQGPCKPFETNSVCSGDDLTSCDFSRNREVPPC